MESGIELVIKPEHTESFEKLFDFIYQGHPEAIRISLELVRLVHVWDDLIDGDETPPAVINAAFSSALFELSSSWLWDEQAIAIARVQYFKWQAANYFEQLDEKPSRRLCAIAYVYRAGFFDLFYYFAYKLYGMAWAEEVAPKIAEWYGESLSDYEHEMWGVKNG